MEKGKIRVAIVEDTEDIRESLHLLINSSEEFTCNYVFEDAEKAMSGLPAIGVDIVLMDIQLPGMSGIECMKQLMERMHHTQFMICTVYDDDDHIFKALQGGASGYILKRTPSAQILEALRDLHDGGSPMSSGIARRVVASIQKKGKATEAGESLTAREWEILDFLSKGFLYKEIATELFISKATVKKHIHNIYEKLHVQTRTEALNKAFYK